MAILSVIASAFFFFRDQILSGWGPKVVGLRAEAQIP